MRQICARQLGVALLSVRVSLPAANLLPIAIHGHLQPKKNTASFRRAKGSARDNTRNNTDRKIELDTAIPYANGPSRTQEFPARRPVVAQPHWPASKFPTSS